jgi:hypothetical protein
MNIAPTPWKMGIPINRAVYAADTTPICICDSMGEATVEQEINHARLVAAAPDLLAALSWFISELSDDSAIDMSKLINEMETRARAAIAKATATN